MGKQPRCVEALVIEAGKYNSAEGFVEELNRVNRKYNSATLVPSEMQRGHIVRGRILTPAEDRLHQAYLQALEDVGEYTKTGSFTDFYNLATGGGLGDRATQV